MSEIEELQSRITAALDRIAEGLDRDHARDEDVLPVNAQEIDALQQELEEEKLANEQLKERNKVLNSRLQDLAEQIETLEANHEQAVTGFDASLQSLRQANAGLRENNGALREANAAGVGEAHLINKAMMTELDSLRADRTAERTETSTILAELERVVANATEDDPVKEDASQSSPEETGEV